MNNSKRTLEFASGLFLLLGIVALLFLATNATDYSAPDSDDSYELTAKFSNIGDLSERAPVTIAGVNVGRVTQITLDADTFQAVVNLRIREQYEIPSDSSASVLTSGLLGDQYIGIEPGGAPDALEPGSEIYITQSAIVVEQLISKYLLNSDSGGGQ